MSEQDIQVSPQLVPQSHGPTSADDDLRRKEQGYRLLVENTTDVIWSIDLNLKHSYISSSIQQLTGFTAEEVMDRGILDLADSRFSRSCEKDSDGRPGRGQGGSIPSGPAAHLGAGDDPQRRQHRLGGSADFVPPRQCGESRRHSGDHPRYLRTPVGGKVAAQERTTVSPADRNHRRLGMGNRRRRPIHLCQSEDQGPAELPAGGGPRQDAL